MDRKLILVIVIAIIVIALGVFAAVSLNNVNKNNNTAVNNTTTEVLNVTNVTSSNATEDSAQQSSSSAQKSSSSQNQEVIPHTTQKIMLKDGTSLSKAATAGHTLTHSLPKKVKTDIHIRECMTRIPVRAIGDICINISTR